MIGALKILVGRANTGKSLFLTDEIARLIPQKVALIVPKQYTYETERSMAERFGGLLSLEVFSLESLSSRVLKETGENREFLSKQGKLMLIRRVLEASRLTFYKGVANSRGFTKECSDIFTRLKAFSISPDDLFRAVSALNGDLLLRDKLFELAKIYQSVENYMCANAIDSMDAFIALEKNIPSSSFSDAHVFLSGIDVFNERVYGIINSLMRAAKSMTVSIRADLSGSARDWRVFSNQREYYSRLLSIANENSIKPALKVMPSRKAILTANPSTDVFTSANKSDPQCAAQRIVKNELLHLESELFSRPYTVYPYECRALELFAATDRTAEVEEAASKILKLVRSSMRFSDISVAASDFKGYENIVRRVFKKENIPLFMDLKRPLYQKNEAVFIMSAIDCAVSGMRQADVFSLIKTGYVDLAPDDIELLENYMLRYGIGGKAMKEPFFKGEASSAMESARRVIVEPLLRLQSGLKQKTVREKNIALFNYLKQLGFMEKSMAITDALKSSRRPDLMDECAKTYNTVIAMFDQLDAIMGDTDISMARYREVVLEGFFAYDVGVIPSTVDSVIFGDVSRTRFPKKKALIIMGANEGLLPESYTDDSLVNDADLIKLKNVGLNTWGGAEAVISRNLYNLYSALTRASELVSFSYSLTIGGKAAQASTLIENLKKIFPMLVESSDLTKALDATQQNPDSALMTLSRGLRRFIDTREQNPQTARLYSFYLNNRRYSERLKLLEEALYEETSPSPIDREMAAALYGAERRTSASELETFNACPFKHYARYVLGAKPRKEYKEQSVDRGIFFHECLDRFLKYIDSEHVNISSLSKESCDELADRAIASAVKEHNDGILGETARGEAALYLMGGAIRDTAYALLAQLNSGCFDVLKTEVEFGRGNGLPPLRLELNDGRVFLLSGKIDRVDAYESKRGQYIRVIDYKSGNVDFNYSELFYGVRLQLPLYIAAYMAVDRSRRVGGLYYLPVKEPVINDDDVFGKDVLQAVIKQFKLSGLTLNDPEIIFATDSKIERYSSVVGIEKLKDGSCKGGLLDSQKLETVIGYSVEKAKSTSDEILSGKNAVSPYKYQKQVACSSCEFKSICRFDYKLPTCTYREARKLDEEKFFDLLGV